MISGMDSVVVLTDDEHENDDADSDSDFETINMNDLRQDHDSSSNSSDSSDSSDWNTDENVPLSEMQAAKRRETWTRNGTFNPQVIPYVENRDVHANFSAVDYYFQYIDQNLFDDMALASNVMYTANKDGRLGTTGAEIRKFVGICLMMGAIKMPRIRMYWADKTRLAYIVKTMSRNRLFLLRKNLKVVNDNYITLQQRNDDKLWKLRPYLNRIREGCIKLSRPKYVCIDEQMIPYTGKSVLCQFVRGKPNTTELKIFVLASPGGLVLDFEIFQGKAALPGCAEDEKRKSGARLGIGGLTVMRLSESLSAGNKLYFDRYLTNVTCIEELMKHGIQATGTVMRRYTPSAAGVPATIDGPRGKHYLSVRSDEKVACVNWMDNKSVLFMYSAHAK